MDTTVKNLIGWLHSFRDDPDAHPDLIRAGDELERLSAYLVAEKQRNYYLQLENTELRSHIDRYSKAVLDAIPMLSGGEIKANLRDVYDDDPEFSLVEHDAKVSAEAIKQAVEQCQYKGGEVYAQDLISYAERIFKED